MDNELKRGIQLFESGNFSEAKSLLKSCAEAKSDNHIAAFYIGRLYMIENDAENAIRWFQEAIKQDEQNSDYHLWLGRACAVTIQKVSVLKKASVAKNVRKEFEKALVLNPDNLEARFGLLQFHLAAPGIIGGSLDSANEQAKHIKKLNLSQGHLAHGIIYNATKNQDMAEKEFLAAINQDSKIFQAYYQLSFLYSSKKEYDKSFGILEKLLSQFPDETDANFYIGKFTVESEKNLEKGEESLKEFLTSKPNENSPSFAAAHYLLGIIYEKKGEKINAKTEFETALKLDPGFEQAKKALQRLK